MFKQRTNLRKKLTKVLQNSDKLKVSFFYKKVFLHVPCRTYCISYFSEEKSIIATAVIRTINKKQTSIILFYENIAEEFLFEDDNYIYHLVSEKHLNGPIDYGTFGRFIPIRENTF